MMRYDKKKKGISGWGGVAGRVKAWGPVVGGQVVDKLRRIGRRLAVQGSGCTSHASGEQDVQA